MLMKYVATLADRRFEKREAIPEPKKPWDHLYDLPVEELKARANGGDADAAFVLGDMHDTGRYGVTRDLTAAADWYALAAERGHGDALNNLGSMNQHGDGPFEVDLVKARHYYEKGAAAGCGLAANTLAHFHDKGRGGLKADPRRALAAFRRAAKLGNGDAMFSLGYRYANGIGTRKRPIAALDWYRRALQAGITVAAYNLGLAYYNGSLVNPDPEKAVALFLKDTHRKGGGAAFMLANAHERGKGTPRNLERALYYYRLASDKGDEEAQEGIDRVLARMGEEFSPAFDPEQRLEDLRVMIRDPDRTFSVQALLLELARIGEMLVEDKDNPAADGPYLLGKSNLIRGFVLWKQQNPDYEGPVDTALMIDERHPFMTSDERISMLTAKAVALGRDEKWAEAIATHRRILSTLEENPPAEEERLFVAMIDLAFCLHENGDFVEAQRMNSEVLARAELAFGREDSRLKTVLNNLAQNEFALERPQQSVALLRRRLAIVEREENIGLIHETLRDLAISCFHAGEREEAEDLFRRRIALAERYGDSRDVEAARNDLEELFHREEQ
ncbi:TPR repeat [Rhizobium sp. NFR07]|uniref:tetratricopeptide repeat protein n=1 Tax=Rhizobium sp. NFR07 TaxID=1566262 RepID=UPI0008E37B6A|nr:SEL1-like repeat protein [Rhizobium sp. NFR07]SFB03156.1 TPR repeat [Rhizobium sp. NFR07]